LCFFILTSNFVSFYYYACDFRTVSSLMNKDIHGLDKDESGKAQLQATDSRTKWGKDSSLAVLPVRGAKKGMAKGSVIPLMDERLSLPRHHSLP